MDKSTFKYCQEYYKVRYNTDKVFICPYFWRDDFVQEKVIDKILKDTKELKVATVEPKLTSQKLSYSFCYM